MIRFKKEKYTVNESAESVTVVVLTNGPTDRNITVQYSTVDGTARGIRLKFFKLYRHIKCHISYKEVYICSAIHTVMYILFIFSTIGLYCCQPDEHHPS